jgi:hypothetical protein
MFVIVKMGGADWSRQRETSPKNGGKHMDMGLPSVD